MGGGRTRGGWKNRNGKNRSENAATNGATLGSFGDSEMMAPAADGADAVAAETVAPQATPPGSPTKTPQQQQISSPSLQGWVEEKKSANGGLPLPILSVPSPVRARGMHSNGETSSVMATSPSTSGATASVAATDSWPLPNCEALNAPVMPQPPLHHHPGSGYREHLRAKGAHAMQRTERWRPFSTAPPLGASNGMPPLTHCGQFLAANPAAPVPPPPSPPPCSMMELASMQPPPPPTPPPLPTTPHVVRHHGLHHQPLHCGAGQMASSVAPLVPPHPPMSLQHVDGWQVDALQPQMPLEVMQPPLPGIAAQPGIDCVQRHDDLFVCTSMGGLANVPAVEQIQVVDKSPEQAMMDAIGEIGGLSANQLAAKLSAASQCRYDD